MKLKEHQVRRRKAILRIVLISTMLGLFYNILAKELGDLRAVINGTLIGFFGGIIIAVFEFKIFNPQYRKLSFLTVLILKTILYFLSFLVLIIGIKAFIDSWFKGLSFVDYLASPDFRNFVLNEDFDVILTYTFLLLSITTFSLQISRKIGYSMMLDIITGRYHTPSEEERIFMLLDIKSSTSITELLGDLKYHQFLNDFYYDITKCILTAKGNIYRYVGDEIIVYWKMNAGLKNANCLQTYNLIKFVMKSQSAKYYNKYGLVPEFITCFHSGKIVVGEIGEVKSQVVFSGETLSELQKLKKISSLYNRDLIISGYLVNKIKLPDNYHMEEMGYIPAVNYQEGEAVYALKEIEKL